MPSCPQWFQDALTQLGGTNPYGEPIFKMVHSSEPRMVIGGKWADGFQGYKEVREIQEISCWCLMVWESREMMGDPWRWETDYRDEETGYLVCGAYPKHGRYRLLQKFLHREIVQEARERHFMDGPKIRTEVLAEQIMKVYRLEPCGVLLDVMIPMLIHWRKLSNIAKISALKQKERLEKEEFAKKAKDAFEGAKLGRLMRGSQLVQKRAEVIERGLREAMAAAAHMGLGMRMGDV